MTEGQHGSVCLEMDQEAVRRFLDRGELICDDPVVSFSYRRQKLLQPGPVEIGGRVDVEAVCEEVQRRMTEGWPELEG